MKVRMSAGIGYGLREEIIEVTPDEIPFNWDEASEEARDAFLSEIWDSWVANFLDGSASVVEDD